MRIGLLQNNPVLGSFQQNVAKVRQMLHGKGPFDLLVLPELALSGYAFKSLQHIRPHLEDRCGPTFEFARELCASVPSKMVLLGYPEVTTDGKRFNSAMLVQAEGLLYSYSKRHLFQTDETWAEEGSDFGSFVTRRLSDQEGQPTRLALGICMDMNPYQFKAPFEAFEFGNFCVSQAADVVVVPMAWLRAEADTSTERDELQTVRYWLSRLGPVLDSDRRTLFLACNRTGSEEDTVYQGNSCAILIDHGKLEIIGKLGREEDILTIEINLHNNDNN